MITMLTIMKNRAFFLDRDGVIIKNIPYLNTVKDLEFLPGVYSAIKQINDFGYKCIVITNQSGVARGIVSVDQIFSIHEYLRRSLEKAGAIIDAFYFCPHHLRGKIRKYTIECDCRKPRSGMFFQAAKEHNLSLANSIMVGDSNIDVEAGRNAGCKSFLLYNQTVISGKMITFQSLKEAVTFILSHNKDPGNNTE
jgi:D-glycero-D-manno-heptose 1,7-bisphosphate phosphatase